MNATLRALATCSVALSSPVLAADPAPLFASSDPIHIRIQAPISKLISDRGGQTVAVGTLTDPAGQQLPISLSLRGITRRTSEICNFPPLRVEFTAPPPATSLFAGEKALKLVTHCRNSADYQQHLLLEYGAYRMLNVLTPRSFRARLANIDYVDASGRPIISRVGFFLEPLKQVAARNGLKETHAPNRIPTTYLSPPDAARYALFQHMIANHDWSMRAGPAGKDCCHNAELIGPDGPGTVVPIPYDFDYSGLVDSPYAVPPEELHIGAVTDRIYRGYCLHNADVIATAREYRDLRAQMIAALTSTPGLDASHQRKAVAFLDGFFADIASDQSTNAKLTSHCVN